MNPEIYLQLSKLTEFFKIRRTQLSIPAVSSLKLCDVVPQRLYIAFTYVTATTALTFSPYPPTGSGDGYPSQSGTSIQEFWIERHKSLVSQSWFGFNSSAGALPVNVIEVLYGVPTYG